MFSFGIRFRFSLQIGRRTKIEIRLFMIEGDARFNDHSARNQTAAADRGLILDPTAARVGMLKIMHRFDTEHSMDIGTARARIKPLNFQTETLPESAHPDPGMGFFGSASSPRGRVTFVTADP
jgi:hypothetical protein